MCQHNLFFLGEKDMNKHLGSCSMVRIITALYPRRYQTNSKNKSCFYTIFFDSIVNILFVVAQFVLATQLLSLGLLYILDLLSFQQFFFIICTQILSLIISGVLMFGNRMLLTSLFSIVLFSFYLVCLMDALFFYSTASLQSYRFIIIIRRTILFFLSFILIKFIVINLLFSSPDDDAHIWDILKSKLFPKFYTFDTQLYTCAKEFDFIDMQTIIKLCRTGLIPLSLLMICRLVYDFICDIVQSDYNEKKQIWNYYHVIQTGVYILMALLIMRLKLFCVPQLCLIISLFMNEELWPKKIIAQKHWKIIVFILICFGMSIQGLKNIKQQLKIKGKQIIFHCLIMINHFALYG